MTTDSNASKTNELMKDGIRQVRDGRYTDAYRTFREVINLDPNNEHAWIWISQTSTDLTERRTALNRAFEINPSSEYAKQALTRLELEESAATNPAPPVRPGVIGGEEAPGQVGGVVRLSKPSADDPNDLRSAIGDGGKKKGKGRGKEPKEVDPRSSGSLRQNPKMVTQSTGKPKGGKRFRLIALVVLGLVVVVTVVVVLVVSPQTPPPSANTTPPSAEATTVDTTTPSAEATTAGATTAAAVAVVPTTSATTPPEATTVASANPSPAVTITSSLTASPATTNSAGDVGLAATPTQVSSNVTATVGVTGTLGVATISGSAITGTTTVSGTASVAPVAATSVTSGTAVTGTTTVSGTASVAPVATVAATSVAPVATVVATSVAPVTAVAATPATTTSDQLNQAQQFVAAGNYKGAISLLNEVLKADPTNVSANFQLGSAYLAAPPDQLGDVNPFDEALKSFKRVTDLAPTWAGGYARLGETYAAKGDLPAAIAAFTRSLELDPNGPERWLALAGLYEKNNQPAEAIYARSRAQGLNPTPTGGATVTAAAIAAPTPTVSR